MSNSSLIFKKHLPLESFLPDVGYYLNDEIPRPVYENNVRTDQIGSWAYLVTNIETYDQITIVVAGSTPLIPLEEFRKLKAEGEKIFVGFEGATIKPYYSSKLKQIVDSIKAAKVFHIKPN